MKGHTCFGAGTNPPRFEHQAIGLMLAVATTVVSVVAVMAQQQQPQAPATTPAPVSPLSTSPPSTAPSSPEIASWQQALVARLARFQRYPAQAAGIEGLVSVNFTIDGQGRVVSSHIVKSSGSAVLDAEALNLIKRAAPFPPPPAVVPDADLSFIVPIRFARH